MPDNRGKYTLDELLKAKRQERPKAEFWVGFDRELKAKQRRLIQKQIVGDEHLRSPFARRFYQFSALTCTVACAAVAVYFGVRTPDSASTSPTIAAPDVRQQVAPPTFTVAESSPVPQEIGIQEFSALSPVSKRRVIVREPVDSARMAQQLPVVANADAPAYIPTLSVDQSIARPVDLDFVELANAAALLGEPIAESDDEFIDGFMIRSFEKSFLLGKYADPLNGDLDPRYDTQPVNAINLQNASFSELDDYLSNQGSKSQRSLDTLTVRF